MLIGGELVLAGASFCNSTALLFRIGGRSGVYPFIVGIAAAEAAVVVSMIAVTAVPIH
jgi:hypothetical protein